MAATRRAYTGGAVSTTTTSAIAASGTTSFTITAYTGWPYGTDPFYIVVEPGTASEEKMLVTRAGATDTTINIASDSVRGLDGTAAVSHGSGVTTFPVFTAVDADEANAVASVISADVANTRIGINDATPSYTLDVNGDINATGDLRVGGTAIGTWQNFTPTFTGITVGNGTVTGRYCQINKLVFWQVEFVYGSTSSVGSTRVSYPVEAAQTWLAGNGGQVFFESGSNPEYVGTLYRYSSTQANVAVMTGGGTYVGQSFISSTIPFTWSTGDRLIIQDFYEAA